MFLPDIEAYPAKVLVLNRCIILCQGACRFRGGVIPVMVPAAQRRLELEMRGLLHRAGARRGVGAVRQDGPSVTVDIEDTEPS